MSNLSSAQFPDQDGLFPADHPAARVRTPAEMSPEQYRREDSPGAWFHGTYQHQMPDRINDPMSSGVHLGTLNAAKDRIDHMGPRRSDLTPPRPGEEDGYYQKPADIHVRRVSDHVQHGGRDIPSPRIRNTPDSPGDDRGEDWSMPGNDRYGEYYKNDAEDIGSTSLRVPYAHYLTNHRTAVNNAIREGAPVHPLTKGLLENHGGAGVDEPIKYTAGSRKDAEPLSWTSEKADTESLLPYKMVGNRFNKEGKYSPGWKSRDTDAAITYVATESDAEEMSTTPVGQNPKWSPAYHKDGE